VGIASGADAAGASAAVSEELPEEEPQPATSSAVRGRTTAVMRSRLMSTLGRYNGDSRTPSAKSGRRGSVLLRSLFCTSRRSRTSGGRLAPGKASGARKQIVKSWDRRHGSYPVWRRRPADIDRLSSTGKGRGSGERPVQATALYFGVWSPRARPRASMAINLPCVVGSYS
jgi:hypothetical protein